MARLVRAGGAAIVPSSLQGRALRRTFLGLVRESERESEDREVREISESGVGILRKSWSGNVGRSVQ